VQRFNGICLISRNVGTLVRFYRELLQVEFQQDGDNYAFSTSGADFTIFSHQGMEAMAPGCMEGSGCGSFTIDFLVSDVDAEFERLTTMGIPIVKPPISYPWGRRSTWFRDPDGNLVNFFSAINPSID